LGPFSRFPWFSFQITVAFPFLEMDQSSFFSSAQAIRLPLASKYIPLLRPAGFRNVVSFPSTLHFRIRSLG
jgi:hypothetical protein